jgi:hypothetical protein
MLEAIAGIFLLACTAYVLVQIVKEINRMSRSERGF